MTVQDRTCMICNFHIQVCLLLETASRTYIYGIL